MRGGDYLSLCDKVLQTELDLECRHVPKLCGKKEKRKKAETGP